MNAPKQPSAVPDVVVEAPRQCTRCNTRTHLYTPDRTSSSRGGWWRVTCTGCGRYYGYWQGADPRANVSTGSSSLE